jgi:hypothetical protein
MNDQKANLALARLRKWWKSGSDLRMVVDVCEACLSVGLVSLVLMSGFVRHIGHSKWYPAVCLLLLLVGCVCIWKHERLRKLRSWLLEKQELEQQK